ncbi:pyrrolidone-carboxylate peptidase [Xenorhabdus hominickii]|uniref:Pyroglutamyl-peptidase I n=1 Tax=Xenorhabdus hominickii TaxID=351679 RepID=A0A2G0Q8N1_XENHO|nr:pyrrolidone-carboxylate peptidase [Xenorhabdus hominickii]PHM57052.1 pyrrolidone-carboxylate peptidase [Xenorhabdus hominickii]
MKALNTAGIPASVSQTAGTFVCNHVMYGLLHHLTQNYPSIRGGFIHVPYLPEQSAKFSHQPSIALELMTKALKITVETAWSNKSDITVIGGATH